MILAFAIIAFTEPGGAVPPRYTTDLKTVNSYTPAEESHARYAATKAGFSPGHVLFALDGNVFFNATRNGQTFALTVTPSGRVYASASSY